MKEQIAHVYTSIRSEVKTRVLMHGMLYAGSGALLLLAGGMFIPTVIMSYIGLPLLFLGGGLILHGLAPYREISKLESNPDQLVVTDDRYLHYIKGGAPYLSVPFSAIDRLSYSDDEPSRYGIVLDLVEGGIERVIFHQKGMQLKQYLNSCQRKHQCDLFFPLFDLKSYKNITTTPLQP